jgi:hypothetical protein
MSQVFHQKLKIKTTKVSKEDFLFVNMGFSAQLYFKQPWVLDALLHCKFGLTPDRSSQRNFDIQLKHLLNMQDPMFLKNKNKTFVLY